MADFIHTIGRRAYTLASLAQEAIAQGLCRRVRALPADLLLGASRVYLMADATKDSLPLKCPHCSQRMTGGKREGGPIPSIICPACGEVTLGKARKAATIAHYFVPTCAAVVVRVADSAIQTAAQALIDFGALEARVDETSDCLRVTALLEPESKRDALQGLLSRVGVDDIDVDLLAGQVSLGAGVAFVAHEPQRLCGRRAHGGVYVMSGPSSNPFVELDPAITYDGPHFRGLKRLENDLAQGIRSGQVTMIRVDP